MPQAQRLGPGSEGLAVFELFVQWALLSHLHVPPGLQGFVPTRGAAPEHPGTSHTAATAALGSHGAKGVPTSHTPLHVENSSAPEHDMSPTPAEGKEEHGGTHKTSNLPPRNDTFPKSAN